MLKKKRDKTIDIHAKDAIQITKSRGEIARVAKEIKLLESSARHCPRMSRPQGGKRPSSPLQWDPQPPLKISNKKYTSMI